MSHRYDDLREWLNPNADDRESRWTRALTNTEMLSLAVAWLAITAAVMVFGVVVLRW